MNWRWYFVGLPIRVVVIGPLMVLVLIGKFAASIADRLDGVIAIGRT